MVIKHSTTHNPNDIVPSADWNADHVGTIPTEDHGNEKHTPDFTSLTIYNAHDHSAGDPTQVNHANLFNVTSDQHHAQAHTLASHSTKAHTELTNVTANQHHAQSHNMASHTDDYSAGGGIDISIGNVISGEDATTANKGIASFNSFDFNVVAGAVSLDDDVISTIDGDAGTATGLGHSINILGGEGIDTAGLADDITISGEDATTANKGIAKFNTLNFSVVVGNVSLGAQGVALNMGTHKINNVVDPALAQDAATKKYVDDHGLTSKTSYVSISPKEFQVSDADISAIHYSAGAAIGSWAGSKTVYGSARVPHNAVITGVVAYGSNTGSTWTLYRVSHVGGATAVASAAINTEDTTITNPTVDNENYSYQLLISSVDNGDEIYGARIKYTTDYD